MLHIPRIPEIWRHRDLRWVAVGRAVSTLGDEVALVALLVHLFVSGAGTAGVSALLIAAALPTVVLAPWAGRLVDRTDSRRLLVTTGVLQAIACGAVAWVLVARRGVLGFVGCRDCTAVVAGGCRSSLAGVGADHRRRCRHRESAGCLAAGGVDGRHLRASAWRLGGRALVAGCGIERRCGLVPHSCVGSASDTRKKTSGSVGARRVAEVIRRVALDQGRPTAPSVVRRSDGIRRRWRDDQRCRGFPGSGVLDGSPVVFGVLGGLFACGAVVGSVVGGRTVDDSQRASWAVGSAAVLATGLILGGLAPSLWVFGLLWAAGGVALGVLNVVVMTLVIVRTKEARRGLVVASVNGLSRGFSLLATLLGGALGAWLGPRMTFVMAGVAALAVTAGMGVLVRRAVRAELAARPGGTTARVTNEAVH